MMATGARFSENGRGGGSGRERERGRALERKSGEEERCGHAESFFFGGFAVTDRGVR